MANEIGITSYLATPSVSFPDWGIPLAVIALALVVLKGFALYKAARNKETFWFWGILILNTFGLLPGIYLFLNRKKKQVFLYKNKVRY